jgi:tight adherence protein B
VTAGVLLLGVGGMLILTGLLVGAAAVLGVQVGGRGARQARRRRPRVEPAHAVAAVAWLLTVLLTGWVAAGVGVAVAVVLVPSILARNSAEQQITRLEALGSWTRRLADLLASGAASTLESALEKSAKVAPAPIAIEVGMLVSRMGPQGVPQALRAFARDVADPVSDELVMALVLQLRHGGRGLAQVLVGLATHVDELVRMRRDVEAARAGPRRDVRILLLLTLGMAGLLLLFARPYLTAFSTARGQVALAGIVALYVAALLRLKQLLRPRAGERVLVDADVESRAAA